MGSIGNLVILTKIELNGIYIKKDNYLFGCMGNTYTVYIFFYSRDSFVLFTWVYVNVWTAHLKNLIAPR